MTYSTCSNGCFCVGDIYPTAAETCACLQSFQITCEQPWFYGHSPSQAYPLFLLKPEVSLKHTYDVVGDVLGLVTLNLYDADGCQWIPGNAKENRHLFDVCGEVILN